MENVRSKIDIRLIKNEKNCLKSASKPRYMSDKMYGTDLIAIRKSKVALTLDKSAYIKMRIRELSKVVKDEFHHAYMKHKYDNN